MARTYKRDGRGRFAGGGGSSGRAQLRAKLGTSASSPVLKRNAATGTAKPKGTVSGSRFGRSVDQFSRESQVAMGRKLGAKVKREAPSLQRQAKAAGLRRAGIKAAPARRLQENTFGTSAPRGTIPKRDPSMAITGSDLKRTGVAIEGGQQRRSAATATRARKAAGKLGGGRMARLRRATRAGTFRRES